MLEKFNNNLTQHIPKLKKEIDTLREKIKTLPKTKIDKILDFKDEIKEKKREIKRLEKEKKEYLLDNSKYIFDYFESKKQISTGEQVQNVKVLNSFFKIKSTNKESTNPDKILNGEIDSFLEQSLYQIK